MVLSIDNNSFIERLRRKAVFHSSNNLKLIIVEGAHVSYCRISELSLILVHADEGTSYVNKLKFVKLRQMHKVDVFHRANIMLHHDWQFPSLHLSLLIDLHEML